MNAKSKIGVSTFLCVWLIVIEICIAVLKYDRTHDLGVFRLINESKYIELLTMYNAKFIVASIIILFGICWCELISNKVLVIIEIMDKRVNLNKILDTVFVLMLALSLVGALAFSFSLEKKYRSEKVVYETRQMLNDQKVVVHALGAIDKDGSIYEYTNSLEALNNCYLENNKVAELDMMVTNDGEWVGAHDGDGTWAYGYPFSEAPTKEAFLSERFMGVLSPLDIDMVAQFMRDKGDFYIVTDIKDNNVEGCRYIAKNYPDLMNHFIIQIYHISEYDEIHNLGFNNIIYTLYQATEDEWNAYSLIEDAKEYDLVGITFQEAWMGLDFFFDKLVDNVETPLFVHTVDDKESIMNDLRKSVLIYTDNTDNDWLR